MKAELDLFINPWAGHYRNRWYWDRLLNKMEEAPWFPERISRRLRGATREEDFLYERAYRLADTYGRIMRNKGFSHVTTTLLDFRRALAKTIRLRPEKPKVICSGDGGIKEALTACVSYVDGHNALEEKVADAFDMKVLGAGQRINEGLQDFLQGLPLDAASSQWSEVSPLARSILVEKEVDFDFLGEDFEISESEQKFIDYYGLTLSDLLNGKLPYPRLGIIRGGTFNVVAHHLQLHKDKKYLQNTIRQMEEDCLEYSIYHPLQVKYVNSEGEEKNLYGSIYGHGVIRVFYELYYGGKIHPGPLKAAYVALLYRYFHKENFAKITAPKPYSYQITRGDGSVDTFEQETTLNITTGISRMPFQIKYFQPGERNMHAAMTERNPITLAKKGLLSIPCIGKPLRLFGVKDKYDIEQDHKDVSELVVKAGEEEGVEIPKVKFMFDGDLEDDNGVDYSSPEVKVSMGPRLLVVNPKKK